MTNICIQQKIPEIAELLSPHSDAFNLYNHMATKSHHRLKSSLGYKIDDHIYTVGLLIYSQLQKTDQNLIEHRFAKLAQTYKFKRVYFHGQVIQSKEYTAVKKRNSFTVQYSCQNGALCLGHAKYYVRCSFQCPCRLHCDKDCLCQNEQYLAVIELNK